MVREKRYAAGPMWPQRGDDMRKEGDIIEEASTFKPNVIQALLGRRMMVEVPYGKWVYVAQRGYKDANGTKPGDIVTDITDKRTLARLINVGRLKRVDSADLEQPKRGPGRPRGSKNKPKAA